MVALIYWSPQKIAKRIHPPDVQNLVAAFRHLQSLPMVDPERVGFAGFCVGASFVLIASAQEEIRDQVAFVSATTPYFDLVDFMRAVGAGARFYQAAGEIRREPWEVDDLTREVAEKLLLESLRSSEEAGLIRAALDGQRDLAPSGLTPHGSAVFRILAGGSPMEIDQAIADLPDDLLLQMAEVSPVHHVSQIRSPVLIMHDEEDSLVPSEESRRLAEALEGRTEVRYTEFKLFRHVTPDRPLGIVSTASELFKLFRHIYSIVRLAT
jgi:dipeptidyl aminopeptidase/acylaminoacyl peptidase